MVSCSKLLYSFYIRVLKINKSSLTSSSTTLDQLSLLAVCKPHTQAITALAVDKEGTLLATGVSEGSTTRTYFIIFLSLLITQSSF